MSTSPSKISTKNRSINKKWRLVFWSWLKARVRMNSIWQMLIRIIFGYELGNFRRGCLAHNAFSAYRMSSHRTTINPTDFAAQTRTRARTYCMCVYAVNHWARFRFYSMRLSMHCLFDARIAPDRKHNHLRIIIKQLKCLCVTNCCTHKHSFNY